MSRAHRILAATATLLTLAAQAQTPTLQQADQAYRHGQAALARGDLPQAQSDFETVVKLAPKAEQGHSALGTVLLNRGRTQQGIRELEAALSIQPSDPTAQTNLALAYQQSDAPTKAIPLFAALDHSAHLTNHPLPPPIREAYARALAATGRLPQAAAQLQSALESQPQSAPLHDELGSLYAQQKHWPQAQHEFAQATSLDPNLALSHLHLALALEAQTLPGSLPELAQAAQLAPTNPTILTEYGAALAASNQDAAAIPIFRQALQQAPTSAPAMLALALALQRSNQLPEAIALLRQVIAAEPNNPQALTNLGLALSQSQQAKQAVPILQRAVQLDPTNPTPHQNLAAAYVQLSQLADAVSQLRSALALAPQSPQLHYDLGVALKLQDDPSAIPELQSAEQLDPSAPEPPLALGMLYLQSARYPDAARELEASLKLRPDNADAWATLGTVYSNLDQLPQATSALQEAIRQAPQQPGPHLTLSAVLVKQNQPAQAADERKLAATLMRANMNRQRAQIAVNAGLAALDKGDTAQALTQFHDALTYDPLYPEAHLGLAKLLDAQGKPIAAAAEREKAAQPAP